MGSAPSYPPPPTDSVSFAPSAPATPTATPQNPALQAPSSAGGPGAAMAGARNGTFLGSGSGGASGGGAFLNDALGAR